MRGPGSAHVYQGAHARGKWWYVCVFGVNASRAGLVAGELAETHRYVDTTGMDRVLYGSRFIWIVLCVQIDTFTPIPKRICPLA